MATSTRTLTIIVDQVGDAKKGLDGIIGSLGGVGTIAAGAATAGIAIAGAAVIGLGAALVDATKEAMAAQLVQAELAAVLESTGGKAGVTAEMANKLASEFQSLTMFEDDAILSGESMLLTFTNIGKDVFPMATEAMLNMAQKFGSMDQASVLLGKALNDPIAGVGALRRVGVQLTDQQEEQIKSFMAVGDVASAQKVILSELETEFGGLAVAAGSTLTGQLTILKNQFGDVKETIGAAFIPILTELAGLLISGLNSPEFQAILKGLSDFVTNTLVPAIQNLVKWFKEEVSPRLKEASKEFKEILKPAMDEVGKAIKAITDALGLNTGEFDILGAILIGLEVTLTIVKAALNLIAPIIRGIATAVRTLADALGWVIDRFDDMRHAAERAVDAIPDWMIPGSPTPLELGLRGIADATKGVNLGLGGMIPPMASSTAAAAGGGGGGTVNVYLNYSPMVSLADRYEAEQKLAPFIQAALRGVA